MNAIEATLLPYKDADLSIANDPEKRLLARIALAERELEEGKCKPAHDVIADLRSMNRA